MKKLLGLAIIGKCNMPAKLCEVAKNCFLV